MEFNSEIKNKTNKKIWRKQNRCKNILKKHEGLDTVDYPTKYLYIGNGGLICGATREILMEIFSSFGSVENIIMIPDKSYSFVIYKDENHSQAALNKLNGTKLNDSVLYLCYIKDIPKAAEIKTTLPPGLILIENFITEEEEIHLLNSVDFDLENNSMKHRKVKHFGYEFNYSNNNIDKSKPLKEKIPETCWPFLEKLKALGHISRIPDQLTINHYLPGQGIPPHIDTHSAFEDEIISLSLGSQVIMEFYHPDHESLPVLLPKRSVAIMTGESRYLWKHGITPRKTDVIPITENDNYHLTLSVRTPRTSFTFRNIRHSPCQCSFINQCDSQKNKIQINTNIIDKDALGLEKEYVTNVYENIAHHFSETRFKAWPLVAKFIEDLPLGSIVIDAGCGNGKNMMKNQKLFMVGCDISLNLAKLCSKRDLQVVVGDILNLPFRNNCADVCICIAVVHHLATEARRLAAVKEIVRLLKPGGEALIYVWALEQETENGPSNYLSQSKITKKEMEQHSCSLEEQSILPLHSNRTHFEQQDIFVPWHKKSDSKVYQRYYHVFKQGEIETLVSQTGVTIHNSYYDKGNWCIRFRKNEVTQLHID